MEHQGNSSEADTHGATPLSLTELAVGLRMDSRDFPGGAVVKNPPANAGDTGWSPALGRSHMPRSN